MGLGVLGSPALALVLVGQAELEPVELVGLMVEPVGLELPGLLSELQFVQQESRLWQRQVLEPVALVCPHQAPAQPVPTACPSLPT